MKYVILDEFGKFSIVDSVHGPEWHDDRYYRKDEIYWMPPVNSKSDLPTSGNKHGDARLILDSRNIYVWVEVNSFDSQGNPVKIGNWLPVLGGYWAEPVEIFSDLPLTGNRDGEIRLVTEENALFRWNENLAVWQPISQPADIAFWEAPVATVSDLPLTGNGDGDVRLVLEDNALYRWSSVTNEWLPITLGTAEGFYWMSPVDTKADLPLTGNKDGEIRLSKDGNDVWRWNATKNEWEDVHKGLIDMLVPPGHDPLQGDIPITNYQAGFLSDDNNFVKYNAGDAHNYIINSLPFNSGDMEFGPGDKGVLRLYKNGSLIDELNLENFFNEAERAGVQSSTPWTSSNGFIVVTFCGMYQNVPYNQYAICHIVFNSGWITPGDNPDIQLIHDV